MITNVADGDWKRSLSQTNNTSELYANLRVDRPSAANDESQGRIAVERCIPFPLPRFWSDSRQLRVLGMGMALPGPALSTIELLAHVAKRFSVNILRRGTLLANRLKIVTRHLCRDLEERHEAPRRGHSNPDLAAAALSMALDEARLKIGDLSYLISHTTSPAGLLPPNVSLVADRVGFEGPYGAAASLYWLRQCTGDRSGSRLSARSQSRGNRRL